MKHSKKIALVLLGTVSLTALSACKEEKSESVETVVGNPAITSSQTPTQATVKNQEKKNTIESAANIPLTTELEEPAIPSPVQAPPTTTQSSNSYGLLPALYGFILGRATSNIGSSNYLPHMQSSVNNNERKQYNPMIIPSVTPSTPRATSPAPPVSSAASPPRGGLGSTGSAMSAGG